MIQLCPDDFDNVHYDMMTLPWAVIRSTESYYQHLLAQNIIGYCDSMECTYRPRPDDMAVMFEDADGFQSWAHVPKDVWAEYIRRK